MKDLLIQTAVTGVKTVGDDSDKNLETNITGILNGIIASLGLACVVVMIIGGVNYMTSAGDTNKVEKGKKTILYGAIGLIICVLSFALVNFVIVNIIAGNHAQPASSYTTKSSCQEAGYKWSSGTCVNK